jgi:hypothetical protein
VPQNRNGSSPGPDPAETRDEGSVTGWIDGLKLGDSRAAQALWDRYFERLVRLARSRLAICTGADENEEDAALSAFTESCIESLSPCDRPGIAGQSRLLKNAVYKRGLCPPTRSENLTSLCNAQ